MQHSSHIPFLLFFSWRFFKIQMVLPYSNTGTAKSWKNCPLVVYHLVISVTTVIQYTNTSEQFCFRYERVYYLLASVHGDVRRETQFLKVFANHPMLTPPQSAVHLVMFKIFVGRDPKKNQHLSKSNSRLFKILKFSGQSLPGMMSSTLQPHFLSRGLLWQMVIFISFAREWKLHQLTMHQDLDPNGSKPYKTEG